MTSRKNAWTDSSPLAIRTTKLNPPLMPSDAVARPRLLERLERDVRRPLTLVSAPAGYGKSTLVAQWLESSSLPGVWLALDQGDSDLRSFLAHLTEAVRRRFPRACPATHDLSGATELPPPAVIADRLANELEQLRKPFVLALDDYHRITNPEIHELLIRLLEHPPRPLHMAILTRHDPPLPLRSMRARGLAVEIREADLQFSAEEARELFRSSADLDLDAQALARVTRGFEGWIVGLRMVCLAVRHEEDPQAFLSSLGGDAAWVHDYLLEEVLSRQSPQLQEWLLGTSIPERLCAPLCEALCGAGEGERALTGQEFMEAVSAANLFTIRLDARGQWLRYHHVFQQMLRHLLEKRRGREAVTALHRRASRWFAAEGMVDEALDHALAAEDTDAAADIVEQHRVQVLNADRWPVLAGWLARLPEEAVWDRPELLLGEAWLAYYRFRIPALTRIAERLDALLAEGPARQAWVAELAMFKAFLCYWQGATQAMLAHVATAEAGLPETHDLMRADTEIYFGLAHHMDGQTDLAVDALTSRVRAQPTQSSLLNARRVTTLAFLHLLSGRLREAAIFARQLGELARASSPVYVSSWSRYLLGCCHFQSGDWEGAEGCFRWMADNRYAAHMAAVMSSLAGLALTLHFLGRADESAAAVELLQDHAVETADPGNLVIAESARARLELLRAAPAVPPDPGALGDAWSSMVTSFIFLEAPAVTRCRVLASQGPVERLEQAVAQLEDLENEAAAFHNTFQLVDLVALKAVTLARLERLDEATDAVRRALEMAAPGGWQRPFIELGPPMADLLRGLGDAGCRTQVDGLLERIGESRREAPSLGNGRSRPGQALIDPLTDRELDVLELLAERLYYKEIAAKLCVSKATVKTHVRHIYQKLDAPNRRQAVIKAEEAGLL